MAPQLNQVQRQTIIALRESGHNVTQIGQRMGISRQTIYFWLKRWDESGTIEAYHRTFYPKSTKGAQKTRTGSAYIGNTSLPTRVKKSNYKVSTTKGAHSTKVAATTGRCKPPRPKNLPSTYVKQNQKNAELNSDDDITDSDTDKEPRLRAQATEAAQEVPLSSGGAGHRSKGCICKFCRREIFGFRYICVQCLDVELCSACEAQGEHCLHYVLRIPMPRPLEEVERVLCHVRRELQAGLLPVAAKDADDTDDADKIIRIKMEVKEEPDLEADPLRDSPHNTAYDMELSSHLDIKIEEEWLDEAREEQELALSHHMTIETTKDKTTQKRPSQNIDTVPEKKPHYNIQSNTPSCSVSGVHIDKNLKLTFTPVQLNESSNFEVHTHESERLTNKGILPRANEKGSSVKKKKDKL